MGAPFLAAAKDTKVYWEVSVLEAAGELLLGLAGSNLRVSVPGAAHLGQDEVSWCVNSGDGQTFHRCEK